MFRQETWRILMILSPGTYLVDLFLISSKILLIFKFIWEKFWLNSKYVWFSSRIEKRIIYRLLKMLNFHLKKQKTIFLLSFKEENLLKLFSSVSSLVPVRQDLVTSLILSVHTHAWFNSGKQGRTRKPLLLSILT